MFASKTRQLNVLLRKPVPVAAPPDNYLMIRNWELIKQEVRNSVPISLEMEIFHLRIKAFLISSD